MHAADNSSDEENDDVKPPTQRLRSISGDDLGDSFSLAEEPRTVKGWVDEILEREDAGDSENEDDDSSEGSESTEDDGDNEGSDEDNSVDDNDECDKSLSLNDWEQSDDDNLGTDLEEDEEHDDNPDDDEEDIEPRVHKRSENNVVETGKGGKESLDAKKVKANCKQLSNEPDIPHLIEAPNSFEELCAMLDNCSNANVIVVINRIRKSNAIALAAENRKKMQVCKFSLLFVCLVSMCVHVCEEGVLVSSENLQ